MSAIRRCSPEKTNSYEIGLSHEWLRRRMRADAAVFRNSFHDLIEFDGSAFPGTWVNIDRSWARGAEFSGTVRVTKFAAVRAGYTELYTRDHGRQFREHADSLAAAAAQLGIGFARTHATPLDADRRRRASWASARITISCSGSTAIPDIEYVFVSGSWQATRHFAPFVRIENALDEVYQETLGYSSLSRTAFGGIRVNW